MVLSCEGILKLPLDIMKAGLDAVNPVQFSRRGMDAKGLTADLGKHWFSVVGL